MSIANNTVRPIRSFVLRQGRMTAGQKLGLAQANQYGLSLPEQGQQFDWQSIFPRCAPLVLEIGFGMGESLVGLAKANPDKDFVGIEVHQPGVGRCMLDAHVQQLSNLKILSCDVMTALNAMPSASFESIYLLFPDPWPKKRHNKRRIVQLPFVNTIAEKLTPSGQFFVATDWQDYAEHMLLILEACPLLKNQFGANTFAPSGVRSFITKYERRGIGLGHAIWDLVFGRALL